jgi:hypothetical protein
MPRCPTQPFPVRHLRGSSGNLLNLACQRLVILPTPKDQSLTASLVKAFSQQSGRNLLKIIDK